MIKFVFRCGNGSFFAVSRFSANSVYQIRKSREPLGHWGKFLAVQKRDLSEDAFLFDVLKAKGIVALAEKLVFLGLDKPMDKQFALICEYQYIPYNIILCFFDADNIPFLEERLHAYADDCDIRAVSRGEARR